ncbi:hypothetical protein DB30_05934 [Enhygromyxa salina]|uniref:Tryptophan synthase alpha chain n=1 Tax=Enhygromyxa salina TaxID=215803 RepID=A0A0C2DC43_9BACT|nr:hypothetical protein [Enhygromyxa salina]KIG19030.1 hypothetical protein DB30_05934 [Enhygromyxa salina]
MQTRLVHLVSFVSILSALACDPKAADPDGMETTTMSGSGGSESESESGGDGPTGEPEGCVPPSGDGFACEVDEDCAISGDCCGCVAFNPDMGSPGNCGGMCDQNKCEEWGIEKAACVNGQCVPHGLSCNQAVLTCDAAAPNCGEGTQPQVWDGCFTGDCLPIDACDWVPSCAACTIEQSCMHETRNGCDYDRCVGPIEECQDQAPCACVGSIFCSGQCTPTAEGFSCG